MPTPGASRKPVRVKEARFRLTRFLEIQSSLSLQEIRFYSDFRSEDGGAATTGVPGTSWCVPEGVKNRVRIRSSENPISVGFCAAAKGVSKTGRFYDRLTQPASLLYKLRPRLLQARQNAALKAVERHRSTRRSKRDGYQTQDSYIQPGELRRE